ncbi:MAG: hypothetical protein GY829_05805 [Gammaproteobacteria bacterium]|nr:hypothetical protein [Gammaproteobacteria bacterium]
MNKRDFNLIADGTIRNATIKKACWDVINEGITSYAAEQRHGITSPSVSRRVKQIREIYKNAGAPA